jgi:hypothetical protein
MALLGFSLALLLNKTLAVLPTGFGKFKETQHEWKSCGQGCIQLVREYRGPSAGADRRGLTDHFVRNGFVDQNDLHHSYFTGPGNAYATIERANSLRPDVPPYHVMWRSTGDLFVITLASREYRYLPSNLSTP